MRRALVVMLLAQAMSGQAAGIDVPPGDSQISTGISETAADHELDLAGRSLGLPPAKFGDDPCRAVLRAEIQQQTDALARAALRNSTTGRGGGTPTAFLEALGSDGSPFATALARTDGTVLLQNESGAALVLLRPSGDVLYLGPNALVTLKGPPSQNLSDTVPLLEPGRGTFYRTIYELYGSHPVEPRKVPANGAGRSCDPYGVPGTCTIGLGTAGVVPDGLGPARVFSVAEQQHQATRLTWRPLTSVAAQPVARPTKSHTSGPQIDACARDLPSKDTLARAVHDLDHYVDPIAPDWIGRFERIDGTTTLTWTRAQPIVGGKTVTAERQYQDGRLISIAYRYTNPAGQVMGRGTYQAASQTARVDSLR